MNTIKLVFCDLEEFGEGKNKILKCCQRLKKENKIVVLNIKKNLTADIKDCIKGVCNYLVCNNGAEIYDCLNDKIIYSKNIDKEVILAIAGYCHNLDIEMILYKDDCSCKVNELNNRELLEQDFNSLELFSKNYDRMLVMRDFFKKHFGQVRIVNENLLYSDKKDGYYSRYVVDKDVTRRKGLIVLLDYLGLTEKQALLIGKDFDYNILNEYRIVKLDNKEDFVSTLEKVLREVKSDEA